MLRVYLDQAEWIELSKAAQGKALDPQAIDALDIARFGVKHDLVRFPLSSAHYIETMRIKARRQREPLAELMGELSEYETIVDQRRLLDMELDLALQGRFGRPMVVRRVDVFGYGIRSSARAA